MGNRKLPFGYQMHMGKIVFSEAESKAVQNIFLEYTLGASLKEITEQMQKNGPPYDIVNVLLCIMDSKHVKYSHL